MKISDESGFGRIVLSSAVVGASAGLFAGMSESPVGTALVAGTFGLIGGGGIFGLLRSTAADPHVEAAAAGETEKQGAAADRRRIGDAATCASVLCIGAVIGVVIGIALREGWILPQQQRETGALVSIPDQAGGLERRQQLKLLLLQTELASLGVSDDQNNHWVSSFIASHEADLGSEPVSLGEEHLRKMKGDARELVKSLDGAQRVLSVPDPYRAKHDEEGELEPDSPMMLAPIEKVRYRDVERAYAYLIDARRFAASLQEYITLSTEPELSVVLDLLTRFREASLAVEGYGRMSSPLRRLKELDKERRLSIKP